MNRTTQPPLKIGQQVEIISGPHAGLVGRLLELSIARNWKMYARVVPQGGSTVEVERDDIVAI